MVFFESRRRIESGKLAVSDLAAEASAFDLAGSLLARYAADRPAELAELAVTLDSRHYPQFADAIRQLGLFLSVIQVPEIRA